MIRFVAGATLLVIICVLLFTVPWGLAGAVAMAAGAACIFAGFADASGGVTGDARGLEQVRGALLLVIGAAVFFFGGRTLANNGLEWMI